MRYTTEILEERNFEIIGGIQGKERPRISKNGKIFTPTKTKKSEQEIARQVKEQNETDLIYLGEFALDICIFNKDGKRADLDNYIKTILDGLNHSQIWFDDKDVVQINTKFFFVDNEEDEGVDITVRCLKPTNIKSIERIERRIKKLKKEGMM